MDNIYMNKRSYTAVAKITQLSGSSRRRAENPLFTRVSALYSIFIALLLHYLFLILYVGNEQ